MSDIKLVSPMLDNFHIGDPISDHNGIRCCPAMKKDSDEKYIVKVISIPASQVQYDALLLTGVCSDRESALAYFNDLVSGIVDEIKTLEKLSSLEGFLPIDDYQIVEMDDDVGYDIYLLSKYQKTLVKQFRKQEMTHLGAINMGLDLCAALSVCRKLGYLYADLKPNNVYLTGEQSYRIGDIGFIKLDSLKYASLPESYRSAYTAPEIKDAYSSLNTTIDIYALGLILYQAYNGGILPVADEDSGTFPPPAYADSEMSEIILKACASGIDDRWQTPIEMGQALVGYMQRNGANDTLIVPYVEPTIIDDNAADTQEAIEDAPEDVAIAEDIVYTEDVLGNLSFLDDGGTESEADEEVTYDEVTEDVSEILAAADEVISQYDSVTEPEIVQEPSVEEAEAEPTEENLAVEIDEEKATPEEAVEDCAVEETPEGETLETDAETIAVPLSTEEAQIETPVEDDVIDVAADENDFTELATEDSADEPAAPKKKSSWWKILIIALLAAGIAVAGYFYYTLCYLQPVTMELNGFENNLTVSVDCAADGLYVICSDAYGNQHKASVVNGKAEFDTLAPDTVYSVTVDTDKFHKLTGTTTASYKTDVQTKVSQFTAVNGAEAGNVILNFMVDGSNSEQWRLEYAPMGGTKEFVTFTGNRIELSGLELDKQYTFRLEPVSELFFDHSNAITFTPTVPVVPENLSVTSHEAGTLTVTWSAPENSNVAKWIVQCTGATFYNETITTTELSATFSGIESGDIYNIQVLAENMSVGADIVAAEGLLSLSDFQASITDGVLTLSWNTSEENVDWLVDCTIDGVTTEEVEISDGNKCKVPYIPNVTYLFTVRAADGRSLTTEYLYSSEPAPAFNNYKLGAEHIGLLMYETPRGNNWDYEDLIYATTASSFPANGKITFLLSIPYEFDKPADPILVTYAIYDAEGNYVSSAAENRIWNRMWNNGYCVLNVPSIPSAPGSYKLAICFNGALVNEVNFTITN